MFHVVLFEPEIPPNTGNIIRLCANTGCALHLIEPLGFSLEEKRLRRAGLDYREFAEISVYKDLQDCLAQLQPANVWALSSKVQRRYTDARFERGDVLLFGPESRGLSDDVKERFSATALTLPMAPESRSLNLANSVAVVVYEAWRQHAFAGAPG